MNRADVALLNNQLDELANNFLRQKQLGVENKRADADLGFRNAQMQHYANMEQREQDRADQMSDRNDILEKQVGLKQAAQDLSEAQSSMKESVNTLAQQVKAGKMSQDDATQYFKDAMDNGIGKTNPQLHDQMLAQPQYRALYDGKMDWSTLADQMTAQAKNHTTTGANDMMVQHWQEAQKAADAATDPNEKAQLQSMADTYKGLIQKASGQVAPADYTQTSVVQKPNPFGGAPTSSTNKVNRVYTRPAAAPSGGAPAPAQPGAAAPQTPTAPTDPTQRVQGQRYRSATNPNLTATWTGQGWDTGAPAAPTQAVPGFGSAQGNP